MRRPWQPSELEPESEGKPTRQRAQKKRGAGKSRRFKTGPEGKFHESEPEGKPTRQRAQKRGAGHCPLLSAFGILQPSIFFFSFRLISIISGMTAS